MKLLELFCGTKSVANVFKENGIVSIKIPKIRDDSLILEMMKGGEIQLAVNIHRGSHPKVDSARIRRKCVELDIPYITTMTATKAALNAIKALVNDKISVNSLKEYYKEFDNK